jgi:DNA-directed RNA polymerase subunit RPC12/RpoP
MRVIEEVDMSGPPFEVKKEQVGEVQKLIFSGFLGEGVNLDQMIGSTQKQVSVYCKDLVRINSMGVKLWINFFSARTKQGAKLSFVECSPAIVKQINLISNFTCGGEVESIYVPFICTKCNSEFNALLMTAELRKNPNKDPEVTCTKCSGKATFDDIREEYFAFLVRDDE